MSGGGSPFCEMAAWRQAADYFFRHTVDIPAVASVDVRTQLEENVRYRLRA